MRAAMTIVTAFVVLLPSAALAEVREAVAPVPMPWLVSHSHAGGAQADTRLDQVVQFWGAGMPLGQVFADVAEQTGVEIGFYPPGDYNERVCVNLYLNPETPPTLRELMAQLAWVTDCGFSYACERDVYRYWLLGTSIGDAVMERLLAEEEAREEERQQRERAEAAARKERVLAAWDECLSALDLSQDELIDRYRGVNDVLLAALLCPEYRAGIDFLASLPREQIDGIPLGIEDPLSIRIEWTSLTDAQRACFLGWSGFAPHEVAGLSGISHGWPRDEAGSRFVTIDLECYTDDGSSGFGISICQSDESGATCTHLPIPLAWPAGRTASPEHGLRIRRAMGEAVSEQDIYTARRAYQEKLGRERDAEIRREAEKSLTERCHLSQAAREQLARIALPIAIGRAYPLWILQEATAAASGLHVVSDCFWQPERNPNGVLAGRPAESALDVLTLVCWSPSSRGNLRVGFAEGSAVAWEWGDAGKFLLFRSSDRDVWRAALLPAEVVDEARRLLEGPLRALAESGGGGAAIEVSLDPPALARLTGHLTKPQFYWGGKLIYSDPAEAANAYLHAYLDELMEHAREGRFMAMLLHQLTDRQWGELAEEGLRDFDLRLSAPPRSLHFDMLRLFPPGVGPTGEMLEHLLSEYGQPPDDHAYADGYLLLTFRAGDIGVMEIPATVSFRPLSTEGLVAPPAGEG